MKPLEILSALPQWAKASADDLLASPAWAMPCRLGEQNCMMRLDGTCPSETLDLLVRFGNEEHVLGLRDCESLQELHAVWPTRAEVPEPILLALVEKDCGTLFQLLENAVRQQLGVIGLASSPRRHRRRSSPPWDSFASSTRRIRPSAIAHFQPKWSLRRSRCLPPI